MIKQVTDEYDELVHYTNAAGLLGILSSQCLWATHAAYLNDADEIKTFLDCRLRQLIDNDVRLAIAELATLPDNEKIVEDHGGLEKVGTDVADDLSKMIRQFTLDFNQCYILSFCAATDERIRLNGLLSQWRGYGKDGGYAIVFDTKGLQLLLDSEGKKFLYQHARWGDVHYYDGASDDLTVAEEIREAEATLKACVFEFVRERRPENLEPIYEPLTMLSCLYKHWGFHEEKEVRVIAIPANTRVIEAERAAKSEKPVRLPKTFIRDGCPVPYIELFASEDPPTRQHLLPIKRVIVGPHREKAQRKQAVELLLSSIGLQASVSISEIPYVTR